MQHGERIGFEFKFSKAPKLSKSMQIAFETLKLKQLIVIYPGDNLIRFTKDIIGLGLKQCLDMDVF